MDENELVKTGMEVMLRPVTDIAENTLGLLGGDWLSEKRARNRAKLKQKTKKILEDAGIKPDDDPSPSVITPILAAAQDEGREELLDLWAALTAAALDPAKKSQYRREFVDIVKQLEPIDILVLDIIAQPGSLMPGRVEFAATTLKRRVSEIQISTHNLLRLQLIFDRENAPRTHFPVLAPLGAELRAIVARP